MQLSQKIAFDPLKGPTPFDKDIPKVIPRPDKAFWVFAYGSLIWKPGFTVQETLAVRVAGYHRRFCVKSTYYRGTEARPGLVVGLRPGGQVSGVVHQVAAQDADTVLSYLEERELRHDGYRPVWVKARAADDRQIPALSFMVPDNSHSYLPLSAEEVAQRIAVCEGATGTNRDYLFNMNQGLREAGFNPGTLAALEERVRQLLSASASSSKPPK